MHSVHCVNGKVWPMGTINTIAGMDGMRVRVDKVLELTANKV